MFDFSYKEAYVFSFISRVKKGIEIETLSTLLLGLYVCDFLDRHETTLNKENETFHDLINEYFCEPRNVWDQGNLLLSVLRKLRNMKILEVKEREVFEGFSLVHFMTKESYKKSSPTENLNNFIIHSIKKYKVIDNEKNLKKCVELFNEKLFSLFHTYDTGQTKHELRFFWPGRMIPKVYQCVGSLFDQKNYNESYERDKYILKDDHSILKLRKNQLQIKNYLGVFHHIGDFTKKRRLQSAKDTDYHTYVEVLKKRFITKIGPQSKIEFSLIKAQKKSWKTICIESNKIETVLALSFLINEEHAEISTYPEFLNKI